MIGIVDYGLGNLASVAGAVEKLGFEPVVSADPAELSRAEKLILPGVGAFGDGMRNLWERGLIEPLTHFVIEGHRPVLGICLGFQLLAEESEEFGRHAGLGWLPARVRRIAADEYDLPLPHIGWNELSFRHASVMFDGIDDNTLFYFVHSYVIEGCNPVIVTGACKYGETFPAAIQAGNIYGTQFHPEKSQRAGLQVLGNFLEKA
jgi:glutamine amidotransferase